MPGAKRVAFHTLGCRLNFSESGSLLKGFAERGYEVVEFGRPADVVFINTCTVTDAADSSCRNAIRRAHRSSPEGKLVVAGCYAQVEPGRVSEMLGVDLVLGTSEKHRVFEYLEEEAGQVAATELDREFHGAASSAEEGRTRAFLKIQDGCDYACSFCIIPRARGRGRAIAPGKAVREVRRLVGEGFQEVVLTGVNIGEYERDSGERLPELVGRVLEVPGLRRLRLSSIEPNTVTGELLDVLAASPRFMPHFHVPLQSGSDAVLAAMRRRYRAADYRRVVGRIVRRFPGAGIGADVIAGFPGETGGMFQETVDLLGELPVTHFHVFPYSRRRGTPAARREDQVQHAVKKRRAAALRRLGEEKLGRFSREQSGKTASVLFEGKDGEGRWQGHTPNFLRVRARSPLDLGNRIREVRLEAGGGGLVGALL